MPKHVPANAKTAISPSIVSITQALLYLDSLSGFYIIGGSQVFASLRSAQGGCPPDILRPPQRANRLPCMVAPKYIITDFAYQNKCSFVIKGKFNNYPKNMSNSVFFCTRSRYSNLRFTNKPAVIHEYERLRVYASAL